MRKRFGVGQILMGVSILSIAAAGFSFYWGRQRLEKEFPDVAILKSQFPLVIYLGKKDKKSTLGGPEFLIRWSKAKPESWSRLDEISSGATGAIVVSEDWAFFNHKGYDANQIREAIKEDLAEGGFSRGASTITQQVVKNVFLTQEKSIWRKLKELFLAVEIEKKVGKRKILEAYLNVVEFGAGLYGISAASQFYFGKKPSELNPREGAFLAMLLPSPKRYSQSFRAKQLTRYAKKTIDTILGKMVQAGYLAEDQLSNWIQFKLGFESGGGIPTPDLGNPIDSKEQKGESANEEPQEPEA